MLSSIFAKYSSTFAHGSFYMKFYIFICVTRYMPTFTIFSPPFFKTILINEIHILHLITVSDNATIRCIFIIHYPTRFYKAKIYGPRGQIELKTRCGQKPIFYLLLLYINFQFFK